MKEGVTARHGFPTLYSEPRDKSVKCVTDVVINLKPILEIANHRLKPFTTALAGITPNYFTEKIYCVPRCTPSSRNEVMDLLNDIISISNLNELAYDELHELINDCDAIFYTLLDNIFSMYGTADTDMYERFCFKRWVDQTHALFILR